MSALRTGDTDFSFSSRDADLLSADRTFVNMVVLTLHNAVLCLRKAPANPGRPGKIFLVLLIAPGNIPRKHAEIAVPDQHQRQPVQQRLPCKCIRQQQDQADRHQKLR